jgi:hypothetical protein
MSSRRSSRRALSCMTTIVLVASIASCSSDLLTPVTHSWTLQTVASLPLPDTIPNSSPVIVVTSGTAVTNSDGSYSFSFTGTSDGTSGVVGADQGHWTISSSTFLFRSSNGVPDYIAALGASSFRVALRGQIVHSSGSTVDMVFTQVQ